MSTNQGVSSLDAERKHFRTYGVHDGLPGLDLTGWGACAKSSTGEMFFGGFSGSTVFDPERVTENFYVPQITLTDFRLFGEEVKLGPDSPLRESITSSASIDLAHWQNFFALEFSALSFTEATTNRYRYMLKGLDPHWIQTGSNARVANYTAVTPGTYQFRVQGATSRGTWSEPGATLLLTIHPPWWSSWWFRLTCLGFCALTILFAHWLRLRQATDRLHVRFEERLAERTRIARELHDTLLQGFHGLMLRFQAVQNLLPDRPVEARRSLEIAIDRAAEAITESRDAVAELRSSAPENSLVEALTLLGKNLASDPGGQGAGAGAAFSVLVEGVPLHLQPILQNDLYSISREAIANAFHHARAKQIELEVRFDGHVLRLRVRDDGIGINRDFLVHGGRDGHWGLPGMRERAKTIGAKLDIWSESNRGTEIELTVPATIAYAHVNRKS